MGAPPCGWLGCPVSGPNPTPQRRARGDASVWTNGFRSALPSVQQTQRSVGFPSNAAVSVLEEKPVCHANTGSPGFTWKGTGVSTQKTSRELPAPAKSRREHFEGNPRRGGVCFQLVPGWNLLHQLGLACLSMVVYP